VDLILATDDGSLGHKGYVTVETCRPVLAHGTGGVSGPAARPIAVRCVCQAVDVPVVAVGGVTTGRDAVEMTLVGATAIGIGSAVYYRGMEGSGHKILAPFVALGLGRDASPPQPGDALQ
jgi:dihydroorotate dehydrogenase